MEPLNPDISLYVHIPFCLRKCRYCDFATYPMRPELTAPFLSALETEAERVGSAVLGAVKTVFFGGGTPSLFERRADEQAHGGAAPLLQHGTAGGDHP